MWHHYMIIILYCYRPHAGRRSILFLIFPLFFILFVKSVGYKLPFPFFSLTFCSIIRIPEHFWVINDSVLRPHEWLFQKHRQTLFFSVINVWNHRKHWKLQTKKLILNLFLYDFVALLCILLGILIADVFFHRSISVIQYYSFQISNLDVKSVAY